MTSSRMRSEARCALALVLFLAGLGCHDETRPTVVQAPDPRAFVWPLEPGNVWSYEYRGSMGEVMGSYAEFNGSDRVERYVPFRGRDYSLVSSKWEDEVHEQVMVRQEGTKLFWFASSDTSATRRGVFEGAVVQSLPWLVADLLDEPGTVRTLVSADSGGYHLRISSTYQGLTRTAAATGDSVYAFSVLIHDQMLDDRIESCVAAEVRHELLLQPGVGAVGIHFYLLKDCPHVHTIMDLRASLLGHEVPGSGVRGSTMALLNR